MNWYQRLIVWMAQNLGFTVYVECLRCGRTLYPHRMDAHYTYFHPEDSAE